MTRFHRAMNSCKHWSLATLMLLLLRAPVSGQQVAVSAPMTADEVIRHVMEKNEERSRALEAYSSVRSYHLECHCISHKKADMLVRADYIAPDKKVFTVVSESGSDTVRNKVFKKLLEAEQESMREENQQRTAITPENYTFQLLDYEKTDTDEFYVLDARPLSKNKFLFRGRIWVNAKDFAITRVEGEPEVNPSWWTVKTDFKRSYHKIGDFYLPESNQSETKVRIFGTAVLTIEYRDYHITQNGNGTAAPSSFEALAPTLAEKVQPED